ncbi:PREDICTED: golgin subfamily A member 6-like protein 22 [Atta cephalotes]|uniref:Uncharacterized protein n=1 Tax=Atta cephalotes TaxID=12957 RepID=A0A158NTK1_ATTCE|nr:PREDICTED: golgin subfamily A member 6-like protein 22 [Atta cephalotes]
MQRYVTGKEESMRKFMREMEKNICKWMEKVNMMGQIEQMRKEWKKRKMEMEEGRRKNKEECNKERRTLERRIEKLKWKRKKKTKKTKDRRRRRNNIVIRDNDLRREKEMQKQLKDKAKEEKEKGNNVKIHKETRNIVKVGNKKSEEFWIEKGLRQGCPLNPTLFNIPIYQYMSDLEEEMAKGQIGEVVTGKEKCWKRSVEKREKEEDKWKKKRQEVLERAEMSKEQVRKIRETGNQRIAKISLRERRKKKEERKKKDKLKECKETKSEIQMEEFIGVEDKGLKKMKKE